MTRRSSLTTNLYKAARLSNNLQAAAQGPGPYAKRVVRRKVYSREFGFTNKHLRAIGMSK